MKKLEYPNRIVCVQGDADRYHLNCAIAVYSPEKLQKAIQMQQEHEMNAIVFSDSLLKEAPRDNEGNPLFIIRRDIWTTMKETAKAHGEEIHSSCGKCLGRIK